MDKRIGSSAGLLALLAVLMHTFGVGGGDKPPAKKETLAAASAIANEMAKPAEEQGPWRATQQFYGRDLVTAAARACRDYLTGQNATCSRTDLLSLFGFPPDFSSANLRALIATIPDPLHTRMSVETDRYLDAIQRAAYRSGWELATQWLPWTAKAERYPGVLAFRHHFEPHSNADEILLVLVVAETPTAGINVFQFQAAQRFVTLAGTAGGNSVLIAGPTFSGSFLSLTRLLEQWPGAYRFNVHAGSVSNSDYARQMMLHFEEKKAGTGAVVEFHGSTLPSVSFAHHFEKLVERWHLRKDQAAELIEDETGFSFMEPGKADSIPVYRYPRDVAQVRNNYNDAAFSTPAKASDAGDASPLAFSLKDTQSGEDIFPMFSTGHTPVSQNAELQQMVRFLKRRSVRLASLSATNVFDTIFLANVLTRSCPDMRIVVRGPDLLFVPEASQGNLNGIMAISAFPLNHESDLWSGVDRSDLNTFSSADQVGEFNAVAALLADGQTTVPALRPYQQPFSGQPASIFSAWLLELGSSGWLPVDFLSQDNPTLRTKRGEGNWFAERERPSSVSGLPPLPRARLGWIVLCAALASFTLAFCGRLFYLLYRPGVMVWSLLCLSDLDTAARSRAVNEIVHHRYLCMICCFTVLGFLNGLLLCPMAASHWRYRGSVHLPLEALLIATTLCSLGTAVYLAILIPSRVCKGGPLETCPVSTSLAWDSLLLRFAIVVQALAGIRMWWIACDSGEAGYLLCFRTIALASPISPVWPLFIAGCGLFAMSYFQLRRFTWGDRRQPHLDTSAFDEFLCNEFHDLKTDLERNLYRPSSMESVPAIPYPLALAVVVIAALFTLLPPSALQSFEPAGFTHIFAYLLLPLVVFTFIVFLRFLRCWSLLKGFLVTLNSVVLGRYMERAPEFSGNGPVWMREVKLLSLASSINSAIALHNLDQTGCLNRKFAPPYIGSLRNFLNPAQTVKPSRLIFIRAYEAFRLTSASISKQLSDSILQPFWTSHPLPYVGAPAPASLKELAPPKAEEEDPLALLPPLTMFAAAGSVAHSIVAAPVNKVISQEAYDHASKYIALQHTIFIGYVLRHLQNLLLCSTFCFVFIVASLNSFVFQIPQAMFYTLTGVLVVSAALVLTVLAQVERDPVMSRLSGTQEGELGKDFYFRALTYGALPVLSVLSTQFPAISRFVSSFVEPALSKLQ